jgi:hypothetical protein
VSAAVGPFGPRSPSCGRNSAAGEIEIGEREEREHLRAVLGDAATAHAAIAELAFDDAEHVLDLRAHLAEAVVPRALSFRETAALALPSPSRPEHTGGLGSALPLVAVLMRLWRAELGIIGLSPALLMRAACRPGANRQIT